MSSQITSAHGRRAFAVPTTIILFDASSFRYVPLESQFQRKLPDTRIARPRHLTESTRSRHTRREAGDSAGREELRVIENVKELRPELQTHAFRNRSVLQECHVPVVKPRPVKPPPRRIALLAQRRISESRGTKVLVARRRLPRIGLVERPSYFRRIDR